MIQSVLQALILGASRRIIVNCGLNRGRLATQSVPESFCNLSIAILDKQLCGLCLSVVLPDGLVDLAGLLSLEHVALGAVPDVDLISLVQDKAIALIETFMRDGDIENAWVSLALDMEQSIDNLWLDMSKARLNASFQIEKTLFEIALE